MAARNALMGFGPNGGYFTDDGQIDAYRSMWTPGSFTGMVAPNQEVGGTGDARTGELPDSNQLPADFWSRLGFTGQAYMQDGAGEQQTGMTRATPELAAWAAANGIEPGFTEGYGGVLQNGQIVPGSAFGNRSNDDANFIAGALGLGAFGGLAAAGGGATTGGLQGAIAQGALTGGAAGGGVGALGTAGQLGAGLGAVGGTAAATGGDPTRAALYSGDGYGAGTAATTGTSGGGSMGSSLADFFSGNGSLSDYMRAGSTLYGMYANDKATDAAVGGQNQANALMRQMYEQNRADNQPLLDMRNSTLPQIQNLLANPSSITSDPGYQFGLQQGQSQIDNQAAARGGYYSGAQLKASQRYGQDYAGTKLTDSLNRLMGVAGLGQVGATANQSNNTNYSQMGGNGLMQQGNNRGSGYIGGANTLLNGANAWMQDNYWQQALKGGGG